MSLSIKLMELEKVLSEVQEDKKNQEEEILTADIIQHLWMMPPEKLRIIYKNGKRPVRIANDEKAYDQLWYLSPDQLKAIFGDNIP